MTAYTANFSNGRTKALANSTREYGAAWLIEVHKVGDPAVKTFAIGFARDRVMAQKAALRELAGMNSTPRHIRQRGTIRPAYWELTHSEIIDVEGR